MQVSPHDQLLGVFEWREDAGQEPPDSDRAETWKLYWKAIGMPWRRMPLIPLERQEELCRLIVMPFDWEKGQIPFKGVRLTRGDVEWLLATHEGNRGPVVWNDWSQRGRDGIAIQGADLRGVDLSRLPLARLRAGLNRNDWYRASEEQRVESAVRLEGSNLFKAHLEDATLRGANLEGANLQQAMLLNTHLTGAQLAGAHLWFTHLEGAYLAEAHLGGRDSTDKELEQFEVWLRSSSSQHWRLSVKRHGRSKLLGADFTFAYFDMRTDLLNATVGDGVNLLDIHWNGINLSRVKDWEPLHRCGQEITSGERKDHDGKARDSEAWIAGYKSSIRAYRQLANELRKQGLSAAADHFAFRAYIAERRLLWWQRRFARWLGSLLLAALSGYGYRPLRSLLTYLLVIVSFAACYYALGASITPHLQPLDALVFSITSFHGRGFSPAANASLHNPLTIIAAIEAMLGLVIEVSFIATFTQRFLGR